MSDRAFNLFAKDNESPWLAKVSAGNDEITEGGPEVARVFVAEAFAGGAVGLAGAASGPHRSSWIPAGELEGERPAADPAEEVTLDVWGEFMRLDFEDGAFVDDAVGDEFLGDEFA
jgi:hypothetical protein